jgi:DNA-binding MarR family transcriptional regulator
MPAKHELMSNWPKEAPERLQTPERLRDEATQGEAPVTEGGEAAPPADLEIFAFVELLFFAYRDFINDPDAILARLNFGRAHHRVLHFVSRYPGLRVADLLSVLKITKQSLGRVLKELVTSGYIFQEQGAGDRRERRLYATEKGAALSQDLAAPQLARVREALAAAGPGAAESVGRFLNHMISQNAREEAARLMQAEREAPAGAQSGELFNGAMKGRRE